MNANLSCPMCGHPCNRAEPATGTEMRCPACFSLFPVKPAAPSPLLARSSAAGAVAAPEGNRTILGQPEAMVRYNCPRCKKTLESPASFAGQKLNCPQCNQRLQIPQPPSPPAAPPINKTILAVPESSAASGGPIKPPPLPANVELVPEVVEERPQRREHCLECGVDITRRGRVQTCPDCGSLFCSAACYREHHYHAHKTKRKKRPRPVECDYCGSKEPPYSRTEIAQSGWITFALLLVFFFPLFWIGLLMTETTWHCADCGTRLD